MKRRSQVNPNDPRGWLFQANIHGTITGSDPSWNRCRHASWHFLSWHRAYVYYFERILREASGDPELTLPYWDWTDAAAQGLPAAFTDPQSPLFESQRSMNQAGTTLAPSIRSTAIDALNLRTFLPAPGFSGFGVASSQGTGKGALEQPPHDGVHVLVGGDDGLMTDPRTAARDPIFWVHHCNVDRLWEVWLRKGGGRANPTASAWLNESISRLFDETGNAAPAVTASQLQTTAGLNYTYDKLTAPVAATGSETGATVVTEPGKTDVAATVEKTSVTNTPKNIELSGDKVKEITSKVGVTSATGDEKKILLRLQGVSVDRPTGSIYEVYLNLPTPPEEASSTSPHFVGVITLFGSVPDAKALREDHSDHAAAGATGEEFLFDVTKMLRTLARNSVDLTKLNVTVLPRSASVEGKPRKVESKATVKIDKISLETAAPAPR
jgi:Common central domain of tyrosinase